MRKYQKTTGYWVYAHVLPTKEVYIGMSKTQPCFRWHPSHYKGTILEPYIEKYGWENIQHKVLIDGLSKEQAEQVEDWFICKATADGFCINKQRSGGLWRDDIKAYNKQWNEDNKEERKAYNKQYRKDHKEEMQAYNKQWYEDHKEERKAYMKQRYSTPEGKIYNRVKNYNRNHTPIETPMEAKRKYLEWGYIPNYIKNDDLI